MHRLLRYSTVLGLVSLGFLAQAAQATSCDPTTAEDPSCGLKAAVEAKYGAGYCADLYADQDGGATLEVYERYTWAGLDDNGEGSYTIEVFPSFTDSNCTIKTTSALEGLDPTYRFYTGITLAATSNIQTTPGEEEFIVNLEPNEFEYTFTGLDFTEYQNRFDSNFYDETLTDRYDSTTEQSDFAPGFPSLTSLTMKADGTFQWGLPEEVDSDEMRADITLYKLTTDGLEFTTFTSKYAPTEEWEYYDWNNVDDGYYLLDGVTAKKAYYENVLGSDGQVNHSMWNAHLRRLVIVQDHEVISVKALSGLGSKLQSKLEACALLADEGEDCSTVSGAAVAIAPNRPKVTKANLNNLKWKATTGATYYQVRAFTKKGKKILNKKNYTETSISLSELGLTKVDHAKIRACTPFSCGEFRSVDL